MSELLTHLGLAENSQKLTPQELLDLFNGVSPEEVDDEFMKRAKEDLKKEIEEQN